MTINVRVESVTPLSQTVRGLRLVPRYGAALPSFEPGAHIDLRLPDERVRSYSLINSLNGEAPSHYDIAVALGSDRAGASHWIHGELCGETLLQISAPRNHFRLERASSAVLLVAGGIGITPLWAMAQHCEATGRPWRLVYAARSRQFAAFLPELASYNAKVMLHFDDEQGGRPLDLGTFMDVANEGEQLYCCGPQPLMQAVKERYEAELGNRLHFEWFSAPTQVAVQLSSEFDVVLSRSQRRITVPADCTLLDVLEQCGVVVPSICRNGVCGTCECAVLSGRVDHRDQVLTDEERASHRTLMPCVSRALDRELVLDL